MLEIENHPLANIIEIIVIDRNHQWILIISEQKCDEKNQVICRVPLHKILINCNGQNSNFTVEKPGIYHLNQVFKVKVTSSERDQYRGPSEIVHRKGARTSLLCPCPKCII